MARTDVLQQQALPISDRAMLPRERTSVWENDRRTGGALKLGLFFALLTPCELGHPREKGPPEGPLIVQFTGGVWNPFSSAKGPVFHRGRGW